MCVHEIMDVQVHGFDKRHHNFITMYCIAVEITSKIYYMALNFSYTILLMVQILVRLLTWGFPGGAVVENLPANAGDMGSSPGLGRSHMPQSN